MINAQQFFFHAFISCNWIRYKTKHDQLAKHLGTVCMEYDSKPLVYKQIMFRSEMEEAPMRQYSTNTQRLMMLVSCFFFCFFTELTVFGRSFE